MARPKAGRQDHQAALSVTTVIVRTSRIRSASTKQGLPRSVTRSRLLPSACDPLLTAAARQMLRRALVRSFRGVLRKDLGVVGGGLSPGSMLDELMQRIRQFAVLIGAALAQLSRYLFGNVANPTFREVKANDANRVVVLAFQRILDDSLKIGVFNVCLALRHNLFGRSRRGPDRHPGRCRGQSMVTHAYPTPCNQHDSKTAR